MTAFTTMLFTWIVFQVFYFGEYGPDLMLVKTLRPHHVLALLTVASWLVARASGQTVRRKFGWAERLLIILTVISTISIIFSGAAFGKIVLRNGQTTFSNKWLVCLLNMTYYPYVTFFCIRALPYNRDFVIKFLKLLCYFGIYLAITGVCEHYPSLNRFVWPNYILDPHLGSHFGRTRGPFMESVAMGRVLSVCFGAWLVLRVEPLAFIRALSVVFIMMLAVAEYFTKTRGPWVGMALICLAFFIYKSPIRKTLMRLGVLVFICAACGLSSKFSVGSKNLFLERQSTITDRIVTWITSIRMIEAHPLIGIGYGRFNDQWPHYFKEGSIEITGFDGSHNTFLTMGAELGLPSLGIWLFIGYLLYRRCKRVLDRLDPAWDLERNFVIFTIGTLWMYYFTGWFSDLKWTTVQNTLMFIMLGIVSNMGYELDENSSDELPEHERKGAEEFAPISLAYEDGEKASS
ncbi:MAG TPA: O-antigen ligase family protein [Verrucomicrobiae bacterium]|jgi:O-antigen ligase